MNGVQDFLDARAERAVKVELLRAEGKLIELAHPELGGFAEGDQEARLQAREQYRREQTAKNQ